LPASEEMNVDVVNRLTCNRRNPQVVSTEQKLPNKVSRQTRAREWFKGIRSVAHTSTWAIVDDNAIAIFKSFLLCNNLGNIQEVAKYLYVPLFSL
jgi:hypothetical protein